MARDGIDPKIFKQVAAVLDPDGRIRENRLAFQALATVLPQVPELSKMRGLLDQSEQLMRTAARANQVFSPRGWGLANFPVDAIDAALEAANTSLDRADEVLAEAWSAGHADRSINRMKAVYQRLELGSGMSFSIRAGRWALVKKAKTLHFAGEYEAAVPMMLANIEGLAADAEDGKLFFTVRENRQLAMQNPRLLTGMVCALTTLHELYTTGVGATTTNADLSRHGILHGRVLGYGTKVVSSKVLTLFDALVDILISPAAATQSADG